MIEELPKVTFGIVTTLNNIWKDIKNNYEITEEYKYLYNLVDSIISLNIDRSLYEIVIVGGDKECINHIIYQFRYFDFYDMGDVGEIIKHIPHEPHLTKQKNLITKHAKYENIVYMHDYLELDKNWYYGFCYFDAVMQPYGGWGVIMNRILNADGKRYRDWVSWDDPRYGKPWVCREKWCPLEGLRFEGSPHLVPYSDYNINHMYISGAYWVAQKYFMEMYPLNEDLQWGEGEDVEWSLRVRDSDHIMYEFNPFSTVHLQKQKDVVFPEIKNEQ